MGIPVRCERGWIKPQEKLKYTSTAEEASGSPVGNLKLSQPFMAVPRMGMRKPTHQAVLACTPPREGVQPKARRLSSSAGNSGETAVSQHC